MKKALSIILSILIVFTLTGCGDASSEDTASSPEVVINMPTDNTVNGYRTKANESSNTSADNISGDAVSVGSGAQNNISYDYCANKSSKIFHKSSCGSVKNMKNENKYYADRETLISEGYTPCGSCKP